MIMPTALLLTGDGFWEQLETALKRTVLSADGFIFFTRVIFPIVSIIIVLRCIKSMLGGRTSPELWAFLNVKGLDRIPVSRWENTIGRSHSSDIVIDFPSVSRTQAALMRDDDGKWSIKNLGEAGSVKVNGYDADEKTPVSNGSVLSIGGVKAEFVTVSPAAGTKKKNREVTLTLRPSHTVLLLTFFQLLTALQLLVAGIDTVSVIVCFGILTVVTWVYYLVMRAMVKTGIEVELLALFLSTIGMAVAAVSSPGELYKQIIALLLGIGVFVALGWYLRDLSRALSIQRAMAIAACVLLLVNLVFGTVTNGARNWIVIGSVSLQPSEFVKVLFIYAGAATLDRLLTRKNLIHFIIFSGICIGILALLGDFGTASIFFIAFLVIAYMRSGDIATLSLICAAVAFGAVMAVKFFPYISARFETWGHAWEYAHAGGFQQTRTMSAAASGGLIGVGAGKGWLSGIVAADTDLVFGVLCEEWGLIIAVLAVLSIAALAAFTTRCSSTGRSSFYVIAACAATAILVFQTILNVLGSVDILPLTGVTFPFVSNGGSSLVSSWGLLAFVKAVDTRRSASFATAAARRFRVSIEEGEDD